MILTFAIAGNLFVFGGEKVFIPPATLYYNYQENPRKRTDFADDFEKFANETWEIEGELPHQRSFAVAEVLEGKRSLQKFLHVLQFKISDHATKDRRVAL